MAQKFITRRDFLNGTLISTAALTDAVWGGGIGAVLGGILDAAPAAAGGDAEAVVRAGPYNPPAWTGMRGSHPGAFERAHELAREGRDDWGGVRDTGEDYDLVVVGGGASGLAAAYFFQRQFGGDGKVLVLDNHDDFGGHAKRNEFTSGGKMRMTYGGSQGFDNIDNWPQEMWDLLDELGIDLDDFESDFYDRGWFKRHGLQGGVYFDAKTWGRDHLMSSDLGGLAPVMPGLGAGDTDIDGQFGAAPLTDRAKRELIRLYREVGSQDMIRTLDERDPDYDAYPYETFLKDDWGIRDPATLAFLRKLPTDESGVGTDSLSLSEAAAARLPGTVKLAQKYRLSLPPDEGDAGYVHHFPDGNAGFCRTLVQALIPQVTSLNEATPGPEDVVLAQFDYAALDAPANPTRVRLNATVVAVNHDGPVDTATSVEVTYIQNSHARRVRGRKVILACWNMIVPYICPGLPTAQKEALSQNVKIPYVFANVMVKNWRAIKKSKIGAAYCPTSFFHVLQTEYPVTMGDYEASENADEPMPVTLIRVPVPDQRGLSPRDQFREGRGEILVTEFADFEREVRNQLNGMFGPFGFDAARDIDAITVNRWPHGYSYSYFNLFDPGLSLENGPHIAARQPYGRIAIANSDAGADSWLDVGVMQGLRAVRELTG